MFSSPRTSTLAQRALGALRLTRSFLLLEDDYDVDWEVDQDEPRVSAHPHRAPLRGGTPIVAPASRLGTAALPLPSPADGTPESIAPSADTPARSEVLSSFCRGSMPVAAVRPREPPASRGAALRRTASCDAASDASAAPVLRTQMNAARQRQVANLVPHPRACDPSAGRLRRLRPSCDADGTTAIAATSPWQCANGCAASPRSRAAAGTRHGRHRTSLPCLLPTTTRAARGRPVSK